MKKIIFLLSLATIVSCSSERTSNGNSGPVHGNSDKKIHGEHVEDVHHEENKSSDDVDSIFRFDAAKANLTFTAYKLPGEKKTGVNGTFKTIHVTGAKEGKHAEEVLSDASFSIPVASLATNDVSRDEKLQTFFFGKLINTTEITGAFGKFEDGKVPVTLKLNDKTVTKDFQYQVSGRKLIVVGTIDLIKDYVASDALNSINEACKDLHEGTTWPDVDLKAEIEL